MGFDLKLAEKAYLKLLHEHNNNHEAFTWEECFNYIFTNIDDLSISNDNNYYNNNNSNKNIINKTQLYGTNSPKENDTLLNTANTSSSDSNNNNNSYNNNNNNMNISIKSPDEKEDKEDELYTGLKVECKICFVNRPKYKIHETTCNHNYCKRCVKQHYHTQINGGIISFTCMNEECERNISFSEVKEFLTESDLLKYNKFKRNIELAKNNNVRWCIKAGCDTPLFRKNKKQNKLICNKCNTEICFKCAGKWHNNTTCDTELDKKLDKWCKTTAREVEFCPSCKARIEKLEGCNHMKCSYCKYEFCWLCRKQYKKGHYDRNNIFGGCPGGERASKRPNRCYACCSLISGCILTCLLPCRVCCWRMQEQGLPWCLCWCCCD